MIRPDLLKNGDKIALIAPARMITPEQVETAYDVFREWGLTVVQGENLFMRDGYFSGTDHQRLSDLQKAIDNSEIKAIFCARGGYGITRILDRLNLDNLNNFPKWIVGFSDVTALHLAINNHGVQSIHGLMPVQYDYMEVERSLSSLHNILFEGSFQYTVSGSEHNIPGLVNAEIVGGNLSLLADSIGSRTELNTNRKILFIEEIDEYFYKIDRMLNQLSRAGKFEQLAGVVLGDFSLIKDTQIPFGKSFEDIVLRYFSHLNIPVAFGFPVGHEAHHLAIPIGRKVRLSVSKDNTVISG